jgi:ABC-type glycerol-3-phosphate transport system permease component
MTQLTSASVYPPAQASEALPTRRRLRLPPHLVLILMSLIVLLPAYFMVITALKSQEDYSANKIGLPVEIVLTNFDTALRGGRFFTWFGNSLILTAGAVGVSSFVSILAAFAFAWMRFPAKNALLILITLLMVIPPVVIIVPIFLMLSRIQLISTYPGTILVYAGLVSPFAVYMLTNFFRTLPRDLLEAALIDGADLSDILLRVIVPLSGPAILTMVIVNALYVWNDLLVALVLLPKDNLRTLMVGITVFGSRYNSDIPVAMAGMLLASVPMVVLYLLGQRYFVRGLVAGAIKE